MEIVKIASSHNFNEFRKIKSTEIVVNIYMRKKTVCDNYTKFDIKLSAADIISV